MESSHKLIEKENREQQLKVVRYKNIKVYNTLLFYTY